MAGITVSYLSFTYPQETVPALRDVSFSEEGDLARKAAVRRQRGLQRAQQR